MKLHPAISVLLTTSTIAFQSMGASLLPQAITFAQSLPSNIPPNVPGRVDQTIPTPNETPRPTPSISPTPIPNPLETPPSAKPTPPSPTNVRFTVKQLKITGNSVLQAEINKLREGFLVKHKQDVVFEDLIELRSAITQLYIQNGYVTSGAFLVNNQFLNDGVVEIQIVEGILEQLEVVGLRRVEKGYVESRIARATQKPLNQNRLREALQLLQLNPLFTQVNATLTAGSAPGQNRLRVELKEAPPINAGIIFNNYQSPSVGSYQGSIFAQHNNLLGLGDRFKAEYGRTEGLNLYSFDYTLPLSPSETTLNLRFSNNNSKITEAPFDDLGIRSRAETISFALRQPIVRSPQTEFAVSLGLDLRRSRTFLLDDIPFSFSEGAEDGRSRVSVIRFSQDWLKRSANQVLAARSQFSFGINAFDATINDSGTDGQFFAWLGQFQWVQRLGNQPSSPVLINRLNAQLTPDSLLSLERFSLGGVDTVRGYRQNQVVTDNGVTGSIELRIPVTRNPEIFQLTPFFEIGGGWNNQTENPSPRLLASLGLGVQWQISPKLDVQIDYGIPLISGQDEGNTLQDRGFTFSIRYQPF
jgi:hemolysin activation/secretion protein